MKKLLVIIALALGLALPAVGQNWVSQSFIAPGVTWLTVSNSVFGVTNLSSFVSRGTNAQGLTYTNAIGTLVTIGPGTNDYKNLTVDASLWADAYGRWYTPQYASGDTNAGNNINYSPSPATVVIRMVGKASNAGGNTVFNFVPVFDGTSTNESNQAGDLWAVAVAQNGTTPVVLATNAPLYKWPGCKSLRLRDIYDTDTSSGGMWIQSVKLVGFRP